MGGGGKAFTHNNYVLNAVPVCNVLRYMLYTVAIVLKENHASTMVHI